MDLNGKVALITGASNGIGEGVARHVAAQGAHVVLADIDDERGFALATELGGRYIHTDVREPADSQAAVACAIEEFGGLHLAHLNAGVTTACSLGDDFDPGAYRQAMSINLDGVVYGIAAARPAIIGSGAAPSSPRPAWPAWWPSPLTRCMPQTNMPSWAWCDPWAIPTPPRGSRSTPLPLVCLHEHHQGFRTDPPRHGFPHPRGQRCGRSRPTNPRCRFHRRMLVRDRRAATASPSAFATPPDRGSTSAAGATHSPGGARRLAGRGVYVASRD